MDIAKAVVFMVSDESEFIYAIDLPVDGGALAIRRNFIGRAQPNIERCAQSAVGPRRDVAA